MHLNAMKQFYLMGQGDFIQSLIDQLKFLICHIELHCVKDGSKPGVCNESTVAFVLILEEGLYQESLVFHLSS